MALCLALLAFIGAAPARAQEITKEVYASADIVSALAGAVSGDTVRLILQNDLYLDSSLDDRGKVIIGEGITAVLTNAPGVKATVTRAYDVWGFPFSPMVTVKGTLEIEEDARNGGALTIDGNGSNYFKETSMFQVAGTLSLNSGTIRNASNQDDGGGAIYGAETSTININGGTISGCYAKKMGGAICAYGDLNITGGALNDNDAVNGGAIYFDGSAGTMLRMTGGSMSNNGARNCSFGGAITIERGSARITGGSFTGNKASAWGGAIHTAVDTDVSMTRLLIDENHALIEGGGIFNCGTGSGAYQKFYGMTLYKNTASGNIGGSAGDDFYSYEKQNAIGAVYLSDYTLSGSLCPWYKDELDRRYQPGDLPAPSSYYQDTREEFALKGGASEADFRAAESLAQVRFTGNAAGSGGAIANNGVLSVGYGSALTVRKTVRGSVDDGPFSFEITLTDAEGKPFSEEIFYEVDGEERTLRFTEGKALFQLSGDQEATLFDIPLGFRYRIRELEAEGYVLTDSENTQGTVAEETRAVFVNVRATSFTAYKRWEGGSGAVELILYANGKELVPQPVCTREGDVYCYEALPRYDDEGREILYAAKERGMEGFLTSYVNPSPHSDDTRGVYDGGTIWNRALASLSVQKMWSGVAGKPPAIALTLYANGEIVNYPQPEPDENGVYVYRNLPLTIGGVAAEYYVVERPMAGFITRYENRSPHEGVTDRAYNGCVITNRKIPKTGDDPFAWAYWALAAVSLAALALMAAGLRKQKT